MTTARQVEITTRLIAAIQTVNGAGQYTFDLSSDGCVVRIGQLIHPDISDAVPAAVNVFSMGTDYAFQAGRTPLSRAQGTYTYALVGAVASADIVQGTAEDTAAQLLEEVVAAIFTDATSSDQSTLAGKTHDLPTFVARAYGGDEIDVEGAGFFEAQVVFTVHKDPRTVG